MIRLLDLVTQLPAGPVEPAVAFRDLALPAGQGARPHVVINMIATVDGKAVVGGPGSTWRLGSGVDHLLFKQLRSQTDAVMAGAGVFAADDPPYPTLTPAEIAARVTRGLRPRPLYVAITGRATLDPTARVFAADPADLLVVSHPEARYPVPVWPMPGERVDLAVVVARLAAEHGVRRLYVIGGPTLNAGLLEAGLVDELFLTVAPQLHGGTRLPSIVEGTGAEPHPHLRLRAAYAAGDELLLRYALGDPPPG